MLFSIQRMEFFQTPIRIAVDGAQATGMEKTTIKLENFICFFYEAVNFNTLMGESFFSFVEFVLNKFLFFMRNLT